MSLTGMEWLQSKVTPQRITQVRKLEVIAQSLGCSSSQLALAWVAKNPRVTSVIMGASKMSQLQDNLGALSVMEQLNDEVMNRIEQVKRVGAYTQAQRFQRDHITKCNIGQIDVRTQGGNKSGLQ